MEADVDVTGGILASNLYDDYIYLHEHPININQADSVELQRLGFLTANQIEVYIIIYIGMVLFVVWVN